MFWCQRVVVVATVKKNFTAESIHGKVESFGGKNTRTTCLHDVMYSGKDNVPARITRD